jgi:hypothetical protein
MNREHGDRCKKDVVCNKYSFQCDLGPLLVVSEYGTEELDSFFRTCLLVDVSADNQWQ